MKTILITSIALWLLAVVVFFYLHYLGNHSEGAVRLTQMKALAGWVETVPVPSAIGWTFFAALALFLVRVRTKT
jgi:hypothetical protein